MPLVYSPELRSRFMIYIDEGLSGRSAARMLKLSAKTGTRWAEFYRLHGHLDAKKLGRPKGTGKIAEQESFIFEILSQDGDL